MSKRLITIVGVATALLLVGTFYWSQCKVPPPTSSSQVPTTISVSTNPQSQLEALVLEGGERVEAVGFGSVFVGRLSAANGPEVVLYRTYPCQDCDEPPQLFVYSLASQQRLTLPFPGTVHLVDGELQESVSLSDVRGVYGTCGPTSPMIWIASRTREVDSTGAQLVPSPDWTYQSIQVQVQADGQLTESRIERDSFAEIKAAIRNNCMEIEPEDTDKTQ